MTEPTAVTEEPSKSEFQLTREMELIISGALVFALLQLPAALDAWWLPLNRHLGSSLFVVPFVAYYVGKLASYGLIVAIMVHFLMRGFWVALLGLRGFYPHGVDEEKLHFGPLLKDFSKRRLLPLGMLEDRVDRLATLTFCFVFVFLLMLTNIVIWSATAGLISYGVSWLIGADGVSFKLFLAIGGSVLGLQMVTALIDRASKKRPLSAPVQRFATALATFFHYGSLNFIYGPVFLTLTTRISRRAISAAQVSFFYLLIGAFAVSVLWSIGAIRFDSYIYFPSNAGSAQLPSSS